MAQLAFALATVVVTEKEIILEKRQVGPRPSVIVDEADELAHFGATPTLYFHPVEQGGKDPIDLWR